MSRQQPKFCVGEEVALQSTQRPEFNTRKTEVIDMVYAESTNKHTNIVETGWIYKTANRPNDDVFWREKALKKLPPEDRTSWEDCVFQPSKVGEEL